MGDVAIIPAERIEQSIYLIRGCKVMLDRDLAALYGVEIHALNQSVTRNLRRFPNDFMFELTREEIMRISQTVTSSGPFGVLASLRHHWRKNFLLPDSRDIISLECGGKRDGIKPPRDSLREAPEACRQRELLRVHSTRPRP